MRNKKKQITEGTMKGRMYQATVAIKDFGERAKIKIIADIGKALREIAMRIA
jgi:hypothetical protein